jgi:hypothetical protein
MSGRAPGYALHFKNLDAAPLFGAIGGNKKASAHLFPKRKNPTA